VRNRFKTLVLVRLQFVVFLRVHLSDHGPVATSLVRLRGVTYIIVAHTLGPSYKGFRKH
jgi:hypothetical protein